MSTAGDVLIRLVDDDGSALIRDAAAEIAALRAERSGLREVVRKLVRRLESESAGTVASEGGKR